MLIFAGSYERFLFGYRAPDADDAEESKLERKFTFAAHKTGVKCIAAAGHFLASGGADDTIHLYDLKHDKDLGFLMNPADGAVPCVQFFTPQQAHSPTHMFSGSADGAISVWQAGGGWEHLKIMRGHKGGVNSLTLHPSGRLALSTARDTALRMWDLVKGRCNYTANLGVEGDLVTFTPSGRAYILVCGTKVTVHDTSGEGGLRATLTLPRRVMSAVQQDDDMLLTGLEDGSVRVWDLRASTPVHVMERAHPSRVRGLAILRKGEGKLPLQLASASTDGLIKTWDLRMLGGGGTAAGLGSAATNARLTCLCVVDTNSPARPGSNKAAAGQGAPATVEPATKKQAAKPGAQLKAQGSKAQAGKGGIQEQQQEGQKVKAKGAQKASPAQSAGQGKGGGGTKPPAQRLVGQKRPQREVTAKVEQSKAMKQASKQQEQLKPHKKLKKAA
mmetsp:Transcript_2944/g.6452  ORF Transcript_2944/g.6452 Transcript_2944/m.6452 type:complete len:445 (-) Transcript_2944:128-1462(-)